MRGAGDPSYADPHMRNIVLAMLHLAVVAAKLCGAGGVRAVMAENLLLKQQLIVLRRARKRAPSLTSRPVAPTFTRREVSVNRHVCLTSASRPPPASWSGGPVRLKPQVARVDAQNRAPDQVRSTRLRPQRPQ